VAVTLPAQHGQRGFGHIHDAEEVGLDLRPEVPERDVLDRREVGVAGVVDDHVEPPERAERELDGGLGGVRVGDVERDRPDLVAVCHDDVVEVAGLAGAGDEGIAGVEDGERDLPAEAARCAGDKEGLRHGSSFRTGRAWRFEKEHAGQSTNWIVEWNATGQVRDSGLVRSVTHS
jgi:hypothetical protein